MTHIRYWAASLATAIAGGFIVIDRFAFTANHAVWIAFAVAVAAAVSSLVATGVALLRENHAFSGVSALSVLVAGFTIVVVRVFNGSVRCSPSGLWA